MIDKLPDHPSKDVASTQSVEELGDFLKIFSISNLGDLKQHCRTAVILKSHFAKFILLCKEGRIPLAHKAVHRESEAGRFLSGHMFQNLQEWHFLFRDNPYSSPPGSLTKCNSHIHLINHLWPNRTGTSVLKRDPSSLPIAGSRQLCIAAGKDPGRITALKFVPPHPREWMQFRDAAREALLVAAREGPVALWQPITNAPENKADHLYIVSDGSYVEKTSGMKRRLVQRRDAEAPADPLAFGRRLFAADTRP